MIDVAKVGGIGEYVTEEVELGEGDNAEEVIIYKAPTIKREDVVDSADYVDEGMRAFLVLRPRKNTIEVRTDEKLRDLLREKYESVMESRYFGRGGIEIVDSGQLTEDEIFDLVRLSYRMSAE